MAKPADSATATGYAAQHLPPGPQCDEIMVTLRVGLKFQQQQHGRRPGFLHRYIAGIVASTAAPATFDGLLEELELEATRRATDGEAAPIETVNRVWELVTYHRPRRGRLQVAFGTLRNYFTAARKEEFTGTAKP